MRETGENPAKYGWYLDLARDGIPPSAGFGIGLERLTRYLAGLDAVWQATAFPEAARGGLAVTALTAPGFPEAAVRARARDGHAPRRSRPSSGYGSTLFGAGRAAPRPTTLDAAAARAAGVHAASGWRS